MSTVNSIMADQLPVPKGHYSHATEAGGVIFISGQLPIGVDGPGAGRPFGDQVRMALGNLQIILEAAGCTRESLLKVTAYIVGIANWDEFNAIYAEMMGSAKPARTIVPVPELHFGVLIEIDAVAIRTA